MGFKINVNFNIKTFIRCPRCREKFEKPTGDEMPVRCPLCGAPLKISNETFDSALREADSKIAGTLGSMGVPMPQKYAEIAKAKAVTMPLNIIGVAATIWAFFFPFPYTVSLTVCALVPVVSLTAMALMKGIISFETKKRKSEKPYLTFALAAPPTALAWRALNDFHILSFDNVWLPMTVLSIVFSLLIFTFATDLKRKPAYLLVTLIFGAMYGYGTIIETNCLPDKSMPKSYSVRVVDKRSSYSSKSHSYYIKVTPWGPVSGQQEISIKKRGFERIKVNDEITINLKDGVLGIPWFAVQMK